MRAVMTVLLLLLLNPVYAEVRTAKDFSGWMMSYYQHPAPDQIAASIKSAYALGVFRDTRKSGAPLVGFIAGAVRGDQVLAAQLANELAAFDDAQYTLVLSGIWYADMAGDESDKIVAAALKKRPAIATSSPFLATPSADLLRVPTERGPWVLDALWGFFFATGDDTPVINIMTALPWIDVSRKQQVMNAGKRGTVLMATAGAARWSLTANAKRHPRVMQICREQISKQPDVISKQLAQIVMNAGK